MKIRPTKSEDISALKLVLEGTELFPSDMLPDMMGGFLSDEGRSDVWLSCETDGMSLDSVTQGDVPGRGVAG